MQRQLVHYFDLHLFKFLSAYRKGYSCESVLLHLIEDWKGALDKNFVVGSVIMDLRTFALIVSAHPYCARKFTPRHALAHVR